MLTHKFMFATGLGNSYPIIELPDGSRNRADEMKKPGIMHVGNRAPAKKRWRTCCWIYLI